MRMTQRIIKFALGAAVTFGLLYLALSLAEPLLADWGPTFTSGLRLSVSVVGALWVGYLASSWEFVPDASKVKALKSEGNVEGLISLLGHAHQSVRAKSAEALGAIGDARAVEPLIAALDDRHERVRAEAARALGAIGDPRAVGGLSRLLTEEFAGIIAEGALERITGREAGRRVPELCEASKRGDLGEVRRLIHDERADVNGVHRESADGGRPLHWALFSQEPTKLELVELLLDNGADVSARMARGQTDEERARRWVNIDVLEAAREVSKFLIGDMSQRARIGLSPLDIAAMRDRAAVARLLIERGADVNARGENAETALHLAALYGSVETARVLVEAGADLDARTNGALGETAGGGATTGGTPLDWVRRRLEQVTLPQPLRERMETIAELLQPRVLATV